MLFLCADRHATMPGMKTPLSPEKIAAACVSSARAVAVEVVQQTGSTNSDLLRRVTALTGPVLLAAESQTAGRGRAGRRWQSVDGDTLTFSLAWPFKQAPKALTGLPLAVGVALAGALASLDVPVTLKWPNDVHKDGKKLAGVLVEVATSGERTWAVIGVGLNLRVSDQLEAEIGHSVAEATWLAQMDRNRLLGVLTDHLVACCEQFALSGFASFMARWNTLHAYASEPVNITDQGKITHQGIALGVNDQGYLLLQDDQGNTRSIMVGDVSLRPSRGESVLLIDAGNTRIKWAIVDRASPTGLGNWVQTGSVLHADLSPHNPPWSAYAVQRVLISNVAGPVLQEQLERAVQSQAVRIERLVSQPLLANIKNHYQNPGRLGSDRFAAAIGAHALFPGQDLLIATCGTATTLDAVSAQGDFIGGMITPGLLIMAESLAKNTRQLPHVPDVDSFKTRFADHTEAAILSGCLAAQVGAIEFAVRRFPASGAASLQAQPPLCILSGGAAAYIAPNLLIPHQRVDNLVLIGLQVISL